MSIKEKIRQLISLPVGLLMLLVVGVVLNIIQSIPLAYSAYADAVKAQFNLTQTQANILESSMLSTMMFLLPAGLIYEAYGHTTVIIINLLMVTFGWSGMWLCVLLRRHLIRYPYIVCAVMAIAGHSVTYGFVFLYTYMPQLVDAQFVPLVMAAMDIGDEIGSFGISLIYETFYINGHYHDAENQSFEGFVLLLLILEWFANAGMAVILVIGQKYRRAKDGEQCNESVSNHETSTIATSSTELLKSDEQSKMRKFPVSYLLILTCTAIPTSILNFESQNITYLSRSLFLVYLNYYLVTFSRVCTIAGKLLMSVILAVGENYCYRYETSLIGITMLLLTFQLLFLFKGTNVVVFFASFIVSNIIQGTEALILPLLINAYYPNDFAFKFSFAWSLICVLQAVIQVTFGRLYDSEIPSGGGQYCYGDHCLANTFIIITCCCVLALLAACSLFFMKINAQRKLTQHKTHSNSD